MYIFNFPFFLSRKNTKYPANNYNSYIYPFFEFFLTNSLKAKFFVFINLYIKKNFSVVLSFRLIV